MLLFRKLVEKRTAPRNFEKHSYHKISLPREERTRPDRQVFTESFVNVFEQVVLESGVSINALTNKVAMTLFFPFRYHPPSSKHIHWERHRSKIPWRPCSLYSSCPEIKRWSTALAIVSGNQAWNDCPRLARWNSDPQGRSSIRP